MARHGRYFLPDQPLHVIQRGNNRSAIFFGIEDYEHYRDWLAEAAAEYGCLIHAYALMTNHVHLLVTPERVESLPRTMQSLGRRYVRAINAAQRRSGTLWEGRYRAAPIDSEAYFLACCRYIELNPVRACMVAHPADYRWSSYRAHAHGAADALVSDHPLYHALGRGAAARQTAYRDLFQAALQSGFVDALRAATNGGWAFGDASFERQLADALRRRVTPLPRGRPRRERGAKQQQLNFTLTLFALRFPVTYRGQMLDVEIGLGKVEYTLREGDSLVIRHETEEIQLTLENPIAVRPISGR